jgi:MFS family permease
MKKVFFGWYIVGASLLLATYNSGVIVYGFTAFIEPFVHAYRWSYAQISLATSIRGTEQGALNPLLGFVVDRWPAKRLILIGTVIWGLGVFLLGRANNLATFYTSFVVIGLGSSLATSMVPTVVVARWFKRDIGKANGVLSMGIGIGGALVPVLVKMIDTYGLQSSLTILAAGIYVLGIPLSFLFRNKPEDYGLLPDGEPPDDTQSSNSLKTDDFSIGPREALKMRAFWQIGVAFMLQIAVMMAMQTHVMPYLESLGVERTTASIIAMSLPLVSLGARIPFGWLADIYPTKYIVAVSLGLKSVGLLLFWLLGLGNISSLGLMILCIISFGLGSGGMTPLRAPVLRDYFGVKRFGTILGFTSIFTTIGLSVGPLAAGWVFDTLGDYGPIWLILAGVALLGAILMVTTPPPRRKSSLVVS